MSADVKSKFTVVIRYETVLEVSFTYHTMHFINKAAIVFTVKRRSAQGLFKPMHRQGIC